MPAIKPMVGTYSYHGFGMRLHPILGSVQPHEGVDIHNDIGTPVYATGDGTVEFSGATGSGYGIAVELNHGHGYKTWYAHLSKCAVRTGQYRETRNADRLFREYRTLDRSAPSL
jgi:murein DD-endopeptidase MepM/ murein hydrolase activator NlpD